ncbi:MAG TPA: DNA-3-methyladenine glycosylase I, partial [Caldithrix abyssi]|nr:DNA-3-methyladenine glycosylase I [Caldithrix abyssi]
AFQAGLSWRTVLHKRENFRRAFAGFDPRKVAEFTKKDITRLMQDAGIIRNRLKIEAAITNARAFLNVQQQFGSFEHYIWDFVDGQPIVNHWTRDEDIPASTPLSDRISKDLKQRGFKFVGTTIVYAHMQATGMVNDHLTDCFRHSQLTAD